ncbi:MAG: hypothetical protein AB7U73_05105 [Pirellulales bacterium]
MAKRKPPQLEPNVDYTPGRRPDARPAELEQPRELQVTRAPTLSAEQLAALRPGASTSSSSYAMPGTQRVATDAPNVLTIDPERAARYRQMLGREVPAHSFEKQLTLRAARVGLNLARELPIVAELLDSLELSGELTAALQSDDPVRESAGAIGRQVGGRAGSRVGTVAGSAVLGWAAGFVSPSAAASAAEFGGIHGGEFGFQLGASAGDWTGRTAVDVSRSYLTREREPWERQPRDERGRFATAESSDRLVARRAAIAERIGRQTPAVEADSGILPARDYIDLPAAVARPRPQPWRGDSPYSGSGAILDPAPTANGQRAADRGQEIVDELRKSHEQGDDIVRELKTITTTLRQLGQRPTSSAAYHEPR